MKKDLFSKKWTSNVECCPQIQVVLNMNKIEEEKKEKDVKLKYSDIHINFL